MKNLILTLFFILLLTGCKFSNKDQNGNEFEIVKIGNEIWMAENLNVNKFSNGDQILEAKSVQEWNKFWDSKTPAWCYYNNKSSNGLVYGKMYNEFAVLDKRGLAPNGWRIASRSDWLKLVMVLGQGDYSVAAINMKKSFQVDSKEGKEVYNFFALPGGEVNEKGFGWEGDYAFWSTSDYEEVSLNFINDFESLKISSDTSSTYVAKGGYYIRCVKNSN
jgi:uncharacterized protein (TIGR02145 family)